MRLVGGLPDCDKAEDVGGHDDELPVAKRFGTLPRRERRERVFR
jgi:hypothetical protein